MFGREVNLKSIFAGVAGARDQRVQAVNFAVKEMVILQRRDWLTREAGENSDSPGTLDGQLRIALSSVFHMGVEPAAARVADVFEVLILIAGVHAEKVVAVGNFVHQQIVDEGSGGSHQTGVLSLAINEPGGVVAGDELDRIE